MSIGRRRFLSQLGVTGAALASSSKGSGLQTQSVAANRARVILDPARTVASLDRRLFGSFVEHIGRCIYEGIYDPGSQFADPNGFRPKRNCLTAKATAVEAELKKTQDKCPVIVF